DHTAEPTQEVGASLDPEQRVAGPDLEAVDERGARDLLELRRIDAQSIAGIRRKQAVAEHRQARDRKSLRTPNVATGRDVMILPERTGPGIEQHADNREVELRARPRGRDRPPRRFGERHPAVTAIDSEVAPSRMEWNVKRRIGLTRDRNREICRLLQPMQIDAKIFESIG